MRFLVFIWAFLLVGTLAFPKDHKTVAMPDQFEIGRHTFIDVGPPFDYYELFLVRPMGNSASIERIMLTPAGNACTQPAKVEVGSAMVKESLASLLGSTNPCAIPEKELRRELKRRKKYVVFSGANVAMQVQCGSYTRIVRSDVLDRDWFDTNPGTPKHTSQTMGLMGKLEHAIGAGPLDQPIFPVSQTPAADAPASPALEDIAAGKYDSLFKDAPDRLSAVYRSTQIRFPLPIIKLLASTPVAPVTFVEPEYPRMAQIAQIEGSVTIKLEIGLEGTVTNPVCESGHPILCASAKDASSKWTFPANTGNREVHVKIEFKLNCHTSIDKPVSSARPPDKIYFDVSSPHLRHQLFEHRTAHVGF